MMDENRKLVHIELDSNSIKRGNRDIEHERQVAIFDLLNENYFCPLDLDQGPYKLHLSIKNRQLIFAISAANSSKIIMSHVLSLSPLRRIVKDYYMICESYYEAIKHASPRHIEAIDMGRRGLHDEGSTLLRERLQGKIDIDFVTARRLFTLICVLHWRGIAP